jgi:hypothetical protein
MEPAERTGAGGRIPQFGAAFRCHATASPSRTGRGAAGFMNSICDDHELIHMSFRGPAFGPARLLHTSAAQQHERNI